MGQGGSSIRPAFGGKSGGIGLDAQAVVHGAAQLLFAPQITFGGLNRYMPEEELNLIQFATGEVAQARAGAALMPAPALAPSCRLAFYA